MNKRTSQEIYDMVTVALKKNPQVSESPLMKDLAYFMFGCSPEEYLEKLKSMFKDRNSAADDYEEFNITGRGTILVPRSEAAIKNKKRKGQIIVKEGIIYEITGLEIMMSLTSPQFELSRAYAVRKLGTVE